MCQLSVSLHRHNEYRICLAFVVRVKGLKIKGLQALPLILLFKKLEQVYIKKIIKKKRGRISGDRRQGAKVLERLVWCGLSWIDKMAEH